MFWPVSSMTAWLTIKTLSPRACIYNVAEFEWLFCGETRNFSKSLVKNAARNDVWLCISARRRARNHRIDVSSGRPLALWWSFIIGRLKWNNLLTRLCELQSTHLLRNIDYLPSVLYNNLTSKWYRNELVKVHLLYRVLPLLNRKYKRYRLVYKNCLVCVLPVWINLNRASEHVLFYSVIKYLGSCKEKDSEKNT